MPKVTKQEVVAYVKASLGYPSVNLEVSDAVIEAHLSVALLFVAPYYSGTVFLDRPFSSVIDLREEEVEEVVAVYQATSLSPSSYDEFGFNFGDIINVNNSPRQRAIDGYNISDDYSTSGQNFKFIAGKLYLSGYQGSEVTIECLKSLEDVSELRDNFMLSWVFKYTLALTKSTVGNIRRKFTIGSNPVQMDGESMASEGQQEKTDLEAQLREGSVGIFFVLR